MTRRDRRMQLPAPGPAQPGGAVERPTRVGEERGVPSRSVLIVEQDQLAVDGPGVLAGPMEVHQGAGGRAPRLRAEALPR